MANNFPRIISINAGEGAGKTTVAAILDKQLEELGYNVYLMGALQTGPFASETRKLFLNQELTRSQEALFKFASIAHVIHDARKTIKQVPKAVVILDRDWYSFQAYDCMYFENPFANRTSDLYMNILAADGFVADLSIYVDLDPKIAQERLIARKKAGGESSFMDEKPSSTHERLYSYFNNLYKVGEREYKQGRYSKMVTAIKNDCTPDELETKVKNLILDLQGL